MLWHLSYAEFYFTLFFLPDFREEHFVENQNTKKDSVVLEGFQINNFMRGVVAILT